MKGMVIRKVTTDECKWLTHDINPCLVVYKCIRHDAGVIGDGIAVTLDPEGGYPFFELPKDSIRWIE